MVSLPIPQDTRKSIEVLYLVEDQKESQRKIKVYFDKNKHQIGNLKKELCRQLKVNDMHDIILTLSSTHYFDDLVNDREFTNDIRKKTQYRSLLCRVKSEREQKIEPANAKLINMKYTKCISHYNNEKYRRSFAMIRSYFFDKNITLKQLHLQIFGLYAQHFELDQQLQPDEIYEKFFVNNEDPPFRLFFETNAKGWHPCYFCKDKSCENCNIPYTEDETLNDICKKIDDKDFNLEIEIYWRKENISETVKVEALFDKDCDSVDIDKNTTE